MTDQTTLDTPFVRDGIEHVSFWNGRVLTGEDLRDEQRANRLSRWRLGRAVGAGIAHGLDVTAGTATGVAVSPGVAVNLEGQALELPVAVKVSLVVPPGSGAAGDTGFTICADVPSEALPTTGTGSGIYLLLLRPASSTRDEAAGVPHGGRGVASVCGPRYAVDGVAFRLVGVRPTGLAAAAGHDATDLSWLASLDTSSPNLHARNVLAHLFLDTRARARLVANPFAPAASAAYGTIDRLRADGTLEDCEVPLALVAWGKGAVQYVETWAVRRPRAEAHAAGTGLEAVGSSRPVVEGAAAYYQFQRQLGELQTRLNAGQRANLKAKNRFRYLPAAGAVPVGPGRFNQQRFFAELAAGPAVFITSAQVVALLQASFRYPPIDVEGGDEISLYRVRSGTAGTPQPYVIFTSGEMPRLGKEEAPPGGGAVGGVDISFEGVQEGELQPGSPGLFRYVLLSQFTDEVEAQVRATVRGSAKREEEGAPAIKITIRDKAGEELPNGLLALEPGKDTDVFVVVDPLPEGVESFTLEAGVEAKGETDEEIQTFDYDEPASEPDPSITIRVRGVEILTGTGSFSGATIALAPKSVARVGLTVEMTKPGRYVATIKPDPPGEGWGVQPTEFEMETGLVVITKGVVTEDIDFSVGVSSAQADPVTSVTVSVRAERSREGRQRTFKLVLIKDGKTAPTVEIPGKEIIAKTAEPKDSGLPKIAVGDEPKIAIGDKSKIAVDTGVEAKKTSVPTVKGG